MTMQRFLATRPCRFNQATTCVAKTSLLGNRNLKLGSMEGKDTIFQIGKPNYR